jgi:hypothetical protein
MILSQKAYHLYIKTDGTNDQEAIQFHIILLARISTPTDAKYIRCFIYPYCIYSAESFFVEFIQLK